MNVEGEGVTGTQRACFAWQKGSCTRGENCKFSHDGPSADLPPDISEHADGEDRGFRRAQGGIGTVITRRLDRHLLIEAISRRSPSALRYVRDNKKLRSDGEALEVRVTS